MYTNEWFIFFRPRKIRSNKKRQVETNAPVRRGVVCCVPHDGWCVLGFDRPINDSRPIICIAVLRAKKTLDFLPERPDRCYYGPVHGLFSGSSSFSNFVSRSRFLLLQNSLSGGSQSVSQLCFTFIFSRYRWWDKLHELKRRWRCIQDGTENRWKICFFLWPDFSFRARFDFSLYRWWDKLHERKRRWKCIQDGTENQLKSLFLLLVFNVRFDFSRYWWWDHYTSENADESVFKTGLKIGWKISFVFSDDTFRSRLFPIDHSTWPSAKTNVWPKVARKVAKRKCRWTNPHSKKGRKTDLPVVRSSADPFSKKDWYDIKAPANFETRNIGRTLVTRTTGTSQFRCIPRWSASSSAVGFFSRIEIASDGLKGRVYEASLGDLIRLDDEDSYRKFKLICEDVQGRHCLTNFHGMDMTTDRLRMLVKKWQVECRSLVSITCHERSFPSVDIDRSSCWYSYIRWISPPCLLHWFHDEDARTDPQNSLCSTHSSEWQPMWRVEHR